MEYEDLKIIEEKAAALGALADGVWEHPETAFTEFVSAGLLADFLEKEGFAVTRGVADIPTAFSARYGSGRPVIGLLGEFDALSGLSQKAGVAQPCPLEAGGNGHGCGHNLLGVGSLAAALAVKQYLQRTGASGTVIYYGCPGEEGGSGKAFMARSGVFGELDCALSWHPAEVTNVMQSTTLANIQVLYTFEGIAAHAAGCPEKGRSALDAMELMNVGTNFLREHMIDAARVHGAITNSGGIAPNVIPAEAQILYAIRAPKVTQVKKLYERMCDIAKGAALITGTTVDIRQVAAYSNVIGNDVLEEVMDKNLDHFIPIGYTEEELAYAGKFKEVVTELDKEGLKDMIAHVVEKDKRKEVLDMPLLDFKLDRSESYGGGGSTDVGDVSWVVPTVQTNVCCYAAGTALHSWQAVAQGKASIAHKGMLTAAKVMACTGADLLENPELIKKAHKDWLEELDGETYPNPLPPEVKPELW